MLQKKSVGCDGMSQEQLVMGSKSLADPLLDIINNSIEAGYFPKDWKDALITPVHKKGSTELLENYRPISCLPAASKLLERIICDQLSITFGNFTPLSHFSVKLLIL